MKIKNIQLTNDDLMVLYAQHHVRIEAHVTGKKKKKVTQDKHSVSGKLENAYFLLNLS